MITLLEEMPPGEWYTNSQIREYAERDDTGPYDVNLGATGQRVRDALTAALEDERYAIDSQSTRGQGRGGVVRVVRFIHDDEDEEDIVQVPAQIEEDEVDEYDLEPRQQYAESDLHPLLAYYARNQFNCETKTIIHARRVRNGRDGSWVFMDMVGLGKSYQYRSNMVQDLADEEPPTFSFEIKKTLSQNSWRESFFQAVANSSWANYSYIVVGTLDKDAAFRRLLLRMCQTYGIGVIVLIDDGVFQHNSLPFYSPEYTEIDWVLVDVAAELSDPFSEFVTEYNERRMNEHRVNLEFEWDAVEPIEELSARAAAIYESWNNE